MIRAGALVLLLAAFVVPPATWRDDKTAANELATKANAMQHFGGASAVATAQVFLSPDATGVLYVTAVAGKVTDHQDAAARVEIDGFLGAPKRAQITAPGISIDETANAVDPARKQIEATLAWSEPGTSSTRARLVIAADGEAVVAVTGECLFREGAPAAARDACTAALATLDPGIAVDKRIALKLAPEGTEPPAGSGGPPSGAPTIKTTMTDGTRTPMAPITVPSSEPARTVDRRPVYVGAGIVVLAGLFWWNRRRRDRLDAASRMTVKKDRDE